MLTVLMKQTVEDEANKCLLRVGLFVVMIGWFE